MNKKLMALAVAGALAPIMAMADESTVTVYGKLSVGVETSKAEGCATNAAGVCSGPINLATGASTGQDISSRSRVTDNASYIGFRGNEPLGGSLSAFFQVESLVKPDSAPGRVTATSANTWANRNSGVGLRGGFGEVLLGRWDTYYTNHIPAGDTLFVKSSYTATVLALFGGTSTIGGLATTLAALTPAGGFAPANLEGRGPVDAGGRRDNIVRYTTPNWGGFTGRVTYVTPEGTTEIPATFINATTGAASNSGKAKDDGVEVSLTYLNPNLGFANYSYYKRNDLGSIVGNDSTNHKLAIGTRLAGFTIGLVGEKNKHENPSVTAPVTTPLGPVVTTLAAVDREVTKYGVLLAYQIDPWAFGVSYAKANKVKDKVAGNDIDKSSANFYQATLNYNFSKRTNFFATYAKIRNDDAAAYDFFAQAAVSDSGPSFIARGADPQSFMIGINHFF